MAIGLGMWHLARRRRRLEAGLGCRAALAAHRGSVLMLRQENAKGGKTLAREWPLALFRGS